MTNTSDTGPRGKPTAPGNENDREPRRHDRTTDLKRELVLLLGGEFCLWDDADTECETCDYEVPGRDLVFHDGMYEYPDEGHYRCVECFLVHRLKKWSKADEQAFADAAHEAEAKNVA